MVSDEIYACSIFGDGLELFASAWDAADHAPESAIEQQVHVVYGLAKDFGVSGLRVGALASRNTELLQLHSNLGYQQQSQLHSLITGKHPDKHPVTFDRD